MSLISHVYKAVLRRVIDGDTVCLDVDLSFDIWARDLTFRLFGINSPEKRGLTKEAGLAASAYLSNLLLRYAPRNELEVKTHQVKDKAARDKYGRWLVELQGFTPDGKPVNLNEQMVAAGHAVRFMQLSAQNLAMLNMALCDDSAPAPAREDDYYDCLDCHLPEAHCPCDKESISVSVY